MTYREMTIETIRIACDDLKERAEELIPNTEGITSIDVILHIPSLTDDALCVPEITVKTDAYVKRIAAEKILELIQSRR